MHLNETNLSCGTSSVDIKFSEQTVNCERVCTCINSLKYVRYEIRVIHTYQCTIITVYLREIRQIYSSGLDKHKQIKI